MENLFSYLFGPGGFIWALAIALVIAYMPRWATRLADTVRSTAVVDGNRPSQQRLLASAMDVYSRLPVEIRDTKEDIWEWIVEAAGTNRWHEIFVVSRGWRNWRDINGALYASLYPRYKSAKYNGAMCIVNAIVVKDGLGVEAAAKIKNRLWKRLQDEVAKRGTESITQCNFFFEFIDPDIIPEHGEFDIRDERRRREECEEFLIKHIGARKIIDNYLIPDMEEYAEAEEVRAALWHKGPEGYGSPKDALTFVYGFHYFWEFSFGVECTAVDELRERLEYVRTLIARVLGECEG